MKKKKRNFIIKICSLLLLGIISITLLGSWTYDPQNDTITSQNLWDEQWEVGALANNGYVNTQESSRRTSSFISILPHHYYSYSSACVGGRYAFYDTNKVLIQFNIDGLENPPTYSPLNAYYLRITFRADYGTTYNHDIMINEGQTLLPYEPYGTYVNKTQYDFVLSEAQRLANAYSEELENNRILQNQYNTLQNQYNTLQSDFTTLQNNYTILQSQFTTLQNNYNALQTEYNNLQLVVQEKNATIDSLENQLDDLQDDYDVLYQTWVDEVAQLNVIISQLKQNAFVVNDYYLSVGHWTQIGGVPLNVYQLDSTLNVSDYLSNNGLLNTDEIFTDYIENEISPRIINLTCQYELSVVNNNLSFTPLILSNIFKVTIPLKYNGEFIGNYEFYPISNLNPNSKLDLYTIITNDSNYANYNLSGLTYSVVYLEYPDNISSLLGYVNLRNNDSYNQGYYQGTIDTSDKFSQLSNDLSTLQGQYNNLEQRYNTLLADYTSLVNTPVQLNFRNLIWYIAETPFTSFKTIWNVDFLGLNIASFITGILSIWLVIFIIKKIFK